jgi:hypothetical protein
LPLYGNLDDMAEPNPWMRLAIRSPRAGSC